MINGEKITVVDLPGFLDSYGCHRSISNRFFTKLIFSRIRNVKFVIASAYNDLERNASNYVIAIESFFKLFNKYN